MNFVELVLLVFPAYVANSIPIIFGGGPRIDGGKKFFDGRPLFGKSKSVRGFLSGVVFGALTGVVFALVLPSYYLVEASVSEKIVLGTALAFGAMVGDLAGSFVKRRLGMPPGFPSPALDQLPFFLVATAFGATAWPPLLRVIRLEGFVFLAALTIVAHLFFNLAANKLGLKKVPW